MKKIIKRVVIVAALLFALFIILGLLGVWDDDGSSTEPQAVQKSEKEIFIEEFAEENDLEPIVAKNLLSATDDIGVKKKNINDIKANGETIKFTYEGYYFTVSLEDDIVKRIESGDIVFYKDGKAIKQVKDYIVSTLQLTTLVAQVEVDVKSQLKAPSTAKFCGTLEYKIQRVKESFKISGYVDSENSFGAKIRSNFSANYAWDGDTKTTPTLIDINIE